MHVNISIIVVWSCITYQGRNDDYTLINFPDWHKSVIILMSGFISREKRNKTKVTRKYKLLAMPRQEQSDFSSWGDYVRSVEQERRNGSIDKVAYENIGRQKISEQPPLNPIRMRFNDEVKEKSYIETKVRQEIDSLSKSNDIIARKFNPINHQGPPRKQIPTKSAQNGRSNREWHLLSQVSESDHKELSIFYDESIHLKQKQSRPANFQSGFAPRTFNILSNQYFNNDEGIKSNEAKEIKEHIKTTFWESHNYDPIRGDYYDIHKDQAEKQTREQSKEQKRIHKLTHYPPSYLTSEGSNYNIMNLNDYTNKHPVIKPNNNMLIRDNTLNRIRNTNQRIDALVQQEDIKAEARDQLRLNRASINRWESELNREYDFITNDKKLVKYYPRVHAPKSILECIQKTQYIATSTPTSSRHRDLATSSTIGPVPSLSAAPVAASVTGRTTQSARPYDSPALTPSTPSRTDVVPRLPIGNQRPLAATASF